MEPVAVVTAFVAALYIVGRGPFLVAPAATAAFYLECVGADLVAQRRREGGAGSFFCSTGLGTQYRGRQRRP